MGITDKDVRDYMTEQGLAPGTKVQGGEGGQGAGEEGAGEGQAGQGQANGAGDGGEGGQDGEGAQAGGKAGQGEGGAEGGGGKDGDDQDAGGSGGADDTGGLQKRFDTVVGKQRVAERTAAYWRKIATGEQPTRAEAAAAGEPWADVKAVQRKPGKDAEDAATKAPAKGKPYDGMEPDDPRPTRDGFTDKESGEFDEDRYIEAVADWRWRVNDRMGRRAAEQSAQESERDKRVREINEKMDAMHEAGQAAFEDYDEVVRARTDLRVTPTMAVAMAKSGAGHEIAYHLGTHPEEAARIAGLAADEQVLEIGELRARFKGEAAAQGGGSQAGAAAGGEGEGDPGAGAGDGEGSEGNGVAAQGAGRRETKAPAAPSASPSGGGAGARRPKPGTEEAVMAERRAIRKR